MAFGSGDDFRYMCEKSVLELPSLMVLFQAFI